jgi:hypothetical protein
MNTTTLRAALARLQALPWADYATRTAAGLRACWIAAQLLAAGLAILANIAFEHRQQIRSALVTAAAALVVAAELAYRAGRHARRLWAALLDASERMGRWYAALVTPPAPEPAPVSLASLSNRELRELLGVRRRLSKRQLLELAAAA